MAITKLVSAQTPNPLVAGAGGDWELAMAQLTACKQVIGGQQMMLTEWTNNTTCPKIAEGTYIQHRGAVYIVDTEDYVVTPPTTDNDWYIAITESGDTLSIAFVLGIADAKWKAQYNGLYDRTVQYLPYLVVVSGTQTVFTKYKLLDYNYRTYVDYLGNIKTTGALSCASINTGAISAASINTGSGAMTFDQGVKTTDSPTFAAINTGQGNNKVVKVSSEVYSFASSTGDRTYNIAPLQVGEFRIVGINAYVGDIGTSGKRYLYVKLPASPATALYDMTMSLSSNPNFEATFILTNARSVEAGQTVVSIASSRFSWNIANINIIRLS